MRVQGSGLGDAAEWHPVLPALRRSDPAARLAQDGAPMSLRTVYAGRAMTMWNTREEAEASWRTASVVDLIQRSQIVWWRATTVEVVDCPADVSLCDVVKQDGHQMKAQYHAFKDAR